MIFQLVNRMINLQTATGITGSSLGTRSGFIQFASKENTTIKIHLNDYNNVCDLNAAIEAQNYTAGNDHIVKT